LFLLEKKYDNHLLHLLQNPPHLLYILLQIHLHQPRLNSQLDLVLIDLNN
jgi:hypothetical protein